MIGGSERGNVPDDPGETGRPHFAKLPAARVLVR
jgi:hypothetical protein